MLIGAPAYASMRFRKGDIVTEIDGQVLMCKYGSRCPPPALPPPLVVSRERKTVVGTARTGSDREELLEITRRV